jgi:hypothetical protein
MNRLYLPDAEVAYERHVLFAVELLDPVSLAVISRGVTVTAPPLVRRPVLSFGGRLVWLREGGRWPEKIIVEPDGLPYERAEQIAPPLPADPERPLDDELLARVVLRPSRSYPFPDGVTVLRGHLNESAAVPPQRVTDAEVWLQWFDSDSGANGDWSGDAASTFSRIRDNGEFAAFLRLAPSAKPQLDSAGRMKVRLRARRPSQQPLSGPVLWVPQGRAVSTFQVLAWNKFA